MVKGWQTTDKGTYYFDLITGAMAKGAGDIDGVPCAFDEYTGIALDGQWLTIKGADFWYEKGVRQGLDGRGKILAAILHGDLLRRAALGAHAVLHGTVVRILVTDDGCMYIRYADVISLQLMNILRQIFQQPIHVDDCNIDP